MNARNDRRRIGVSTLVVAALALPFAAGADEPVPAAFAPAAAVTTTTTTTTVTTVSVVPPIEKLPPPWTLATLPDDPVPFHGLVNMDAAGTGPGGMLYPTAGLGLIGLLAAVATHAVIIGGIRSSQETRLQVEADKVLDPYRGALAGFRLRSLEQRALSLAPEGRVATLRGADEVPAGDLLVQVVPSFSMTPDASALVLDEVIVIKASGAADATLQQTIRVVSYPRSEEDLAAAWNADEGAAIKSTAASMMAESLAIALSRLPATPTPAGPPVDDKTPFRTMRYALGGLEKMERAQLIGETCEHLLIRTLRGGIMSVPHRSGATLPEGCPPAPPMPVRKKTPVAAPAASGAASAIEAGAFAPTPVAAASVAAS